MSGEKMFNDYVEEFQDFVEVLEGELPEYKEVDAKTIKPKATTPRPASLFFDEDEQWYNIDEHWGGMPDFKQKDLKAHKSLLINFSCEEDVQKFAELVGAKITPKTPSIWYPAREQVQSTLLHWIDESEAAQIEGGESSDDQ